MTAPPFTLRPARTPADFAAAARLFGDYAASLGIDLGYQDFNSELAGLPGEYAPPGGELLLAFGAQDEALGCVALRPLEDDVCEMKRLYLAPAARGLGIGKALVAEVLAQARRLGYGEMRLDTLPKLAAAIGLYEAEGFRRVAAYYETPIAETIFLALDLRREPKAEAAP